jgi:hypothetical protein
MFIHVKICRAAAFLLVAFSTVFGSYGAGVSTSSDPTPPIPAAQPTFQADVIVYAATPSGIMASL